MFTNAIYHLEQTLKKPVHDMLMFTHQYTAIVDTVTIITITPLIFSHSESMWMDNNTTFYANSSQEHMYCWLFAIQNYTISYKVKPHICCFLLHNIPMQIVLMSTFDTLLDVLCKSTFNCLVVGMCYTSQTAFPFSSSYLHLLSLKGDQNLRQ